MILSVFSFLLNLNTGIINTGYINLTGVQYEFKKSQDGRDADT